MRFLITLLSLVLVPALSLAAVDAGGKLVIKSTQGKAKIVQTFKALDNINGYVLEPASGSGRGLVVYADKDGRYMVVGNLINKDGKSLTEGYMQKYVTSKLAKDAYTQAAKTFYFTDGSNKAPHKAYIIIDPNCIFCHKLYTAVFPLIDKGDLQVRWIPAGFLKPSSKGKAAALLNAKTDKEASALLRKDELNFNTRQEEGGLKALSKNSDNAKDFKHVQYNTDFFSKFGFQGTPTMLYKDSSGKPQFFPGYVAGAQLKALVNKMGSSW